MKALTWQGLNEVAVQEVPEPRIEAPTDAIVRVTSTAICGSDLHLYGVLAPYLQPGDILGHEFMGIVEEVGSDVGGLQVGDRVVVPFNISCGHCWMCSRGLFAQCETTQNRDQGKGASLFGYTEPLRRGAGRAGGAGARPARGLRPGQAAVRGAPTNASSTCPTSCRPLGRGSSTPTCRTAARSRCSVSARSASSQSGRRSTAASPT